MFRKAYAILLIISTLFAFSSCSGKNDNINASDSGTPQIKALELINSKVREMTAGQKTRSYLTVKAQNHKTGYDYINDLEFISTNTDIAIITPVTDTLKSQYVYFDIQAISAGTASVYIKNTTGDLKSEEITVNGINAGKSDEDVITDKTTYSDNNGDKDENKIEDKDENNDSTIDINQEKNKETPEKDVNDSQISSVLKVVAKSNNVSANSTASINIKGKPNTIYSITVYYSSGASKAKGLEDKKSDGNGKVSWSWKVGSRTKQGTYRIVISGGNEKIETNFTVK